MGEDRASGSPLGKAIAAALRALRRRGWSVQLLRRLEWRRFGELCRAYFEALGYRTESARCGSDGLEIALYEAACGAPAMLVRCSARHACEIEVAELRELLAAVSARSAGQGMFVTSGAFTAGARDFAATLGLRLVDGAGFSAYLQALPAARSEALLALATRGDFTTPTCPSCDVKMIAQHARSSGEKLWLCPNYPRCDRTFLGSTNAPV
jgi:restriction system protein